MNRVQPSLLIICAIAAVAGLWLFNPFHLYFLNDDFIHIPLSKNGELFQRKSFRPFCDISIALDYWLWKKEAWGYHLTNLLLHGANSLMVYIVSSQLLKLLTNAGQNSISLLAATLFFIYPFHSESIYWIIGRSGSLGSLFFLAALSFYLRRNDNRKALLLSLLFFAGGLLTYESVWIFPLVAATVSLFEAKRTGLFRKEIRHLIVIVIVFLLFLITRFALLGEIAGSYEAADFKDFNVQRLAFNFSRVFIRSFAPPVESVQLFIVTAIVVTVIVVAILSWALKAKKSSILFVFTCFIISLLPYLSLGVDTHGVEGERYLYLPSIFVCLLLVYALTQLSSKGTQVILCLSIFSYSIYFLAKARSNYVTAGNISRTTIQQIGKLLCPQYIQVDSLPQEVHGALIFRMGFTEALAWMCDSEKALEAKILSTKTDNTKWSLDYKTEVQKGLNVFENKPHNTLHLVFTDSTLKVIE